MSTVSFDEGIHPHDDKSVVMLSLHPPLSSVKSKTRRNDTRPLDRTPTRRCLADLIKNIQGLRGYAPILSDEVAVRIQTAGHRRSALRLVEDRRVEVDRFVDESP